MLNVVYITDENYAMPTCVTIASLMQNTKRDKLCIYILANGISDLSKKRFGELPCANVKIEVVNVHREGYASLSKNILTPDVYVTESALFKFDIPNILCKLDRVLYMDGDTIIQKDVTPLFDCDISDCFLAAVDEMGDSKNSRGNSCLAERLGIDAPYYFNSGVILFNLEKMRKESFHEKLMEYRTHQKNYFMDQDAFNAVCDGKWYRLPYEYNFRTALFDIKNLEDVNAEFYGEGHDSIESCINSQTILHLSDKKKPWIYYMPWFTEIFLKYYNMSPYRYETLHFMSPLKELSDRIEDLRVTLNDLERKTIWKLPVEKIPHMAKIIIYGAGNVGADIYRQAIMSGHCNVVGWVDKNFERKDKRVENPKILLTRNYDYILIAIYNRRFLTEAVDELKEMGLKEEAFIEI